MSRSLAIVVVVAACDSAGPSVPSPAPMVPAAIAADSNIFRTDYVGPDRCGECHTDEHARWQRSLHRVMNARAEDPGAIVGNFDGQTVHYAGREAHFERDARGYAMTLDGKRFRVTRTIGRRGLQEYVGIPEVSSGQTNDEVRLPWGWWPRLGGWFPQPYFDPWLGDEASFDAFAAPTEPWATRCPWCHSTYPFAQRVARRTALGVGHGPEQALALELPGGSARLDVAEQVTVGISCESCHLGGRSHAAGGPIRFTPNGTTRFEPGMEKGGFTPTFEIERRDARVVNATCAQCHSGPSPRLADRTALRNSSEALDLAASPCTTARCTDCHDPHAGDRGADITANALAACTRCHDRFADPAVGHSHAGAHADVPGVTCLDCHMPRVVMGLDHFVRSHRISSPTDPRLLATAEPNACNLCHLDRSIRWTMSSLARDHDAVVAVPRSAAQAYAGDLDAPVGEVWLADARPALRLIAAHAYARNPALGRAALPLIARGLTDKLAYVRAWTLIAVEDMGLGPRASGLGRNGYDVMAPSAAAVEHLLHQPQ